MKKAKWLSEDLQTPMLCNEEKQKAKEQRKDIPFECRVPKNSKKQLNILMKCKMKERDLKNKPMRRFWKVEEKYNNSTNHHPHGKEIQESKMAV